MNGPWESRATLMPRKRVEGVGMRLRCLRGSEYHSNEEVVMDTPQNRTRRVLLRAIALPAVCAVLLGAHSGASAADLGPRATYSTCRYMVKLRPGLTADTLRNLRSHPTLAFSSARYRTIGDWVNVRFDTAYASHTDVLARMRTLPQVIDVEPVGVVAPAATPNDPDLSDQWGLSASLQGGFNTDIDAGDPDSPRDPDGSRADIGALGPS